MKTNFKTAMALLFLLSCCVTFGGNTGAYSSSNSQDDQGSLITSWLEWIPDTGFTETNFEFAELQETLTLTISWTTSLILKLFFDLTTDFDFHRIMTGFF